MIHFNSKSKEVKKKKLHLEFARELRKLWNIWVMWEPNVSGDLWTVTKCVEDRLE